MFLNELTDRPAENAKASFQKIVPNLAKNGRGYVIIFPATLFDTQVLGVDDRRSEEVIAQHTKKEC